MERGPLSSSEFQALAKTLVPFVHVTSRVEGEKYADLSLKAGPGWPQAAIFDRNGLLLARIDTVAIRSEGAAAIEQVLNEEVAAFEDLRKKAAKGDKEARAEFFMARFDLGHVGVAEMRGALGKGSILDEYQRDTVREQLVELATTECLAGHDADKPETFGPYAKKLLAQHKAIGLPEGPSGITAWRVIMEDAFLRKDAATFALAFTAIKATGITGKKFNEANKKRLASLRQAGK